MRNPSVRLVFILAGIMIAAYILNIFTAGWANQHGIVPRTLSGFSGIPLSPFLHAGAWHLIGNLTGFVPLALLVCISGRGNFVKASLITIILGGLLVWALGRQGNHIGASGWVFGLWGFLIANAWFTRNIRSFALAAIVVVFYGGLLWGLIPKAYVSFEGHIFGLFAGVVAALVLTRLRKAEL